MAGKRIGVGDVAKGRMQIDRPEVDIFAPTEAIPVAQPSEPVFKTQSYQLTEEQIGALGLKAAATGKKKNAIVREMFDEALAPYIVQYRQLRIDK